MWFVFVYSYVVIVIASQTAAFEAGAISALLETHTALRDISQARKPGWEHVETDTMKIELALASVALDQPACKVQLLFHPQT